MTNKQAFDKLCRASMSFISYDEEHFDAFDLYIRTRKAVSGEDLIFIEQDYDNNPDIFVSSPTGFLYLKYEIVRLMPNASIFIEPSVAQMAGLFPGDDFWLMALKGNYDTAI
jgi:hypothetical protein